MNPLASQADSQERSALFVATLTSFIGPFMISSVNVALPAIQVDLGMNAVQLSWVGTAYLLAVAIMLLPAGRIADLHGRKKIFTAGLIVYTLAATLAGFAVNAAMLLSLRLLQGLGAGMFVTTGMAILTSIFPPQRRGRVLGIYVAAVYVGLSVGPFVGGMLSQHWGWRSIFFLMLPLGLLSIVITVLFLRGEWVDSGAKRLDLVGAGLYAAAVSTLVYGASILPSRLGFVLVAMGVGALLLFFWQQTTSSAPVFEVNLFRRNHAFAFSSLAALLNYSATFAVTFLMSLYLQYIKGMPAQQAGTILMAQPVVMALLSPLAGRLSERIQVRLLATSGMAITVIGVLLCSRFQPETPIKVIVATLVLLGLGFALFSSPNMSAIMGSVEKRHYGVASGLAATMRLMGQMISMAIATVVLAAVLGKEAITPAAYPRFLISMRIVFTCSALLCSLGVFFSFFRGRVGDMDSSDQPSREKP